MAMLGKRFQRTTSMSQIGPAVNLHAEKAQQNYYQHQQQKGELAGEHQPANQWDIVKNAEAMMMMMMSSNAGGSTTSEETTTPLVLMAAAATQNEQVVVLPPPQICASPRSPAAPSSVCVPAIHMMSPSPATLVVPTHHFLDACFYCKRRLRPERDIFIYRGDAAFCTEECRHRQILNDETRVRASKKGGGASSETAIAA